MTAAEARLDRARRDALRFARDARRLARRHATVAGRRADGGRGGRRRGGGGGRPPADAERLSAALKELDRLWELAPGARASAPTWRGLLEMVAVAALLALLVARAAWSRRTRVRSISMEPTNAARRRLLV